MNLNYKMYFPWGEEAYFDKKIIAGYKIHTIRKGIRGIYINGILNHRQGRWDKGFEFCKNICKGIQKVEIKFKNTKITSIKVEGNLVDIALIAKNDGLTVGELERWFYEYKEGDIFNGFIIHWTDLKY